MFYEKIGLGLSMLNEEGLRKGLERHFILGEPKIASL